jgi:hypothetical protein
MIARVKTVYKDQWGNPDKTKAHYDIIPNDEVPGLVFGFNPKDSKMYCWVGGKVVLDDKDGYKDLSGNPAKPYMNVQPAGRQESQRVDIATCSKGEHEVAYKILSAKFPEFIIHH